VVCPDYDELELFATGDLDEEANTRIQAHLASCPPCERRLGDVSSNIGVLPSIRAVVEGGARGAAGVRRTRLGSYEITGELGRGGMGVVYEALQRNPRRFVALKVLDVRRASSETLRRFEYESQILGHLRHPGIAQVFEAGTENGHDGPQPYFVMELVRGPTLREFVGKSGLDTRRRLELLAKVCDAVHHAHQQGVIHRDLKPSNILIDDTGQPKILDFGVARFTHADIEAATLQTEGTQLLGTLPYMSPEQAAGDPKEVDVRSDVYALGVVAYEVLSGRTPLDLRQLTIPAGLRAIQDQDPPRLGTIDRTLRGDVEAIVAKALEKDKTYRYQSAAEMAVDLRRFLRNEPILAVRHGRMYALGKFARRHRAQVSAAAAITIVLVAATIVSAGQAIRARRAEREVAARLDEVQEEAAKLSSVNQFLEDMLSAADPSAVGGDRDVTVRRVLDQAVAKLDEGSLAEQPEIEASVRATIGNTYRALGDLAAAEPHLRIAVEKGRALYPGGHTDLAYSMHKLARLTQELGQLEEAEGLFRESLAMRRDLLGPDHEDIAKSLNGLGWLRQVRGDYAGGRALHQEALEMEHRLYGESHTGIATTLNNLAIVSYRMGDYAEAERLYRESLAMDKALRGKLHINIVTTTMNLAVLLQDQGRLEEAEPLMRESAELQQQLLGPDHPAVATGLNNLARLLQKLGKPEEAEAIFRSAIDHHQRSGLERHPVILTTKSNLAMLLVERGELDEAEALHREVLDSRGEILGESHTDTISSVYHLATVIMARGDDETADGLFAEAVERGRRNLPPGHWYLGLFLRDHGECLMRIGRLGEAEARLTEAVAILEEKLGKDHERTRMAEALLAQARQRRAEFAP
jgi:tetratricopeptide (TPR) repeat protein/predicted Ser/Thr protein kinase